MNTETNKLVNYITLKCTHTARNERVLIRFTPARGNVNFVHTFPL